MHRFFLPPSSIKKGRVTFPDDQAHQIRRVLRLKTGSQVIVLDNCLFEYEVLLDEVSPGAVYGEIQGQRQAMGEPLVQVTLFVSLTQREKFEWILQKCTEAGVSTFYPCVSTRSLVQRVEEPASRVERWERILREAAEQSGRGRIPRLFPALRFEQALQVAKDSSCMGLIFWEQEDKLDLGSIIPKYKQNPGCVSLFVGPEGGFSPDEIVLAHSAGIHSVSLGRRIMRMETASLVASALVIYELEKSMDQSSSGGAACP